MPGRPQKFNDALERKQRDKLREPSKDSEEVLRPDDAAKTSLPDVPKVPVGADDNQGRVQTVSDDSSGRGQKPNDVPMVHSGSVGLHVRQEAGEGKRDKTEVEGKVPTTEGKAAELGHDGNAWKKRTLSLRLINWLSNRVGKRIAKSMHKKDNTMPDETNNNGQPPQQAQTDSTELPQLDPGKFLVSKNVWSMFMHAIVPVLCMIIFNLIRATKPDFLWPESMDQEAVNKISELINELLIGVSTLSAAYGSARDLKGYADKKAAAAKSDPTKTN